MLAPLAAGVSIVIRRRTPAGRDASGNDTFTTVDVVVSGCAAWPGSAGRNAAGSRVEGAADFRNSVVTRAQVLFPEGTVVGPLDLIQTPDGAWWRATGEGQTWTSQLTGASTGVEVSIEKVDG